MVRIRTLASLFAAAMLVVTCAVRAGDVSSTEIDKLKKDVEDLRKQLNASKAAVPAKGAVERAMDKYGPDANVTTKLGKLTIGGLLQVWYTASRTDHTGGAFSGANGGAVVDSNVGQQNNTFRVRRAELRFTMEIHENVTAVVMMDPATEASSFAGYPDNQGLFKRVNNVAPETLAAGTSVGSAAQLAALASGAGSTNKLLQDAYINYHGVIPHHDFQVGQFLPAVGEEGIRSSAELDFIERSLIGQVNNQRDLGVSAHGKWWDDRFQYWLGLFDGAGNFYGTDGVQKNRADTNSNKDFNYRLLVRPVWENETWGSLELGWSSQIGRHGNVNTRDLVTLADVAGAGDNLLRTSTWATKYAPWVSYKPNGPVKGMWLRGEYLWMRDRNAPNSVIDLTDANANGLLQTNGTPFSSQGWYAAVGYKMSESRYCDSAPSWLKPFEFVARYERFQNIQIDNQAHLAATSVYYSDVMTGGINYYIRKHNAKIQLNVNSVTEPTDRAAGVNLHQVKNNSLALNFQVAF